MADYQNLIANINSYIKTNGQGEITATVLNTVLQNIVSNLGLGYQYLGIATPITNPGTPDQRILYLAVQAGDYTNFDNITVNKGLSILRWDSEWHLDPIFAADANSDTISWFIPYMLENINALKDYSFVGQEPLSDSYTMYNPGIIRSLYKIPVNGGDTIRWNCGIAPAGYQCVLIMYDSAGQIIDWFSANAMYRDITLSANATHIHCSFVEGTINMGIFKTNGDAIFVPKTVSDVEELFYESNVFNGYAYNNNGALIAHVNAIATVIPISVAGGAKIVWSCGQAAAGQHNDCCFIELDSSGNLLEWYSATTDSRVITLNANTRYLLASFHKNFAARALFLYSGEVLFIPRYNGAATIAVLDSPRSFGPISANAYANQGWGMNNILERVVNVCCSKEKISISGITHVLWICGDTAPYYNSAVLIFYDANNQVLDWYSSYTSVRIIPVPSGAVSFVASFRQDFEHAAVRTIDGQLLFAPVIPSLQEQISNDQRNNAIIDVQKIDDFAAVLASASGLTESFLLFSDPHWYQDYNSGDISTIGFKIRNRIFEFWKQSPVDFAICLGDWLTSHIQSAAVDALASIDAIMTHQFQFHYFPVFGNHDNNYQGSAALSDQQVINLMFRKWGRKYYAEDGYHTRFYVFDTGIDWTTSMDSYKWGQVDWFAQCLLQRTDEHIIILMHIVENTASDPSQFLDDVIPLADNITKIANAFNQRTSITLNGITYNFSGRQGTIHCVICGHTHFDATGILNSIPVFNITTTMNADAYDLTCIDYSAHLLKTVRVGSGINRQMSIL